MLHGTFVDGIKKWKEEKQHFTFNTVKVHCAMQWTLVFCWPHKDTGLLSYSAMNCKDFLVPFVGSRKLWPLFKIKGAFSSMPRGVSIMLFHKNGHMASTMLALCGPYLTQSALPCKTLTRRQKNWNFVHNYQLFSNGCCLLAVAELPAAAELTTE